MRIREHTVFPTPARIGGMRARAECRRKQNRRYDIQLTPASLFHLVVIFLDLVQNSIEPRPVMSPTPNFDSFQPPKPNGSRGTGTPTLTPTMPALACSITYRATPPLSVKTLAAFP